MLIPLAPEGHRRSQILHSHLELVLTAALRARPDVITARILMPLDVTDRVMERPGRAHGLLGVVPGWNHTTLAPTAVVWRVAASASAGGRNTSTTSTGVSISLSDR